MKTLLIENKIVKNWFITIKNLLSINQDFLKLKFHGKFFLQIFAAILMIFFFKKDEW